MSELWDDQPETFGIEPHQLVKVEDPFTSRAAANGIDIDAQMWKVLKIIRDHGGARSLGGPGVTGDDLEVLFGVSKMPYSSVKAHVVNLERQCYIERPQITRPGSRFGNAQLVIWALTKLEREQRLLEVREGLSKPATQEIFNLIREWLPLQQQLDELNAKVEELKLQIIDIYLPGRPLGLFRAFLGNFSEDGKLRDFYLRIEIKRYSKVLRLLRRPK